MEWHPRVPMLRLWVWEIPSRQPSQALVSYSPFASNNNAKPIFRDVPQGVGKGQILFMLKHVMFILHALRLRQATTWELYCAE